MNRKQAEKLLAAMVFDDLDESSKAELLTYLQTDDDLRDRLADMRMAVKLICDAVNDGPDPVLAERRLKKLRQLASTQKRGRWISSPQRILAAAAVLTFGLMLISMCVVKNFGRRTGADRPMFALDRLAESSPAGPVSRSADPEIAYRTGSEQRRSSSRVRSERIGGTGGMGGMGMGSDTTNGFAMGGMGGMGGGMDGTTSRGGGMIHNAPVAYGDTNGEPPSDGPADSRTSYYYRGRPSGPAAQAPSDASTVVRHRLDPSTSFYRDSVTSAEELAQLEQLVGMAAGIGSQDTKKSMAQVPDTYSASPEGRGISDALVVTKEASSLSRSAESSSSSVANGDMDRLQEALESRKMAAPSTVEVGVPWGKPTGSTTAPVPAQPAPTADEKGNEELDFLGGQAVANGRVPALGDTPLAGGLFRLQSQGERESEPRETPEESARKDRPDSTPPIATKTDQPAIADREGAVALQDMPGLDTALPSFESRFRAAPVNPWVMAERDAQSTFALDVDTASYTLCRRYIRSGFLPPIGAVRMEEFINAFDYAYPQRDGATFAVYAEGTPSPFAPAGQDLTLLKIAVKARTVGRDQRRAAHIVFVVDASASMGQPDRLPLVQAALNLLVDKLDDADRISLVTCADEARLHLEAVPAKEKETIRRTIDAIQPAGRTNLLAGLKVGYDLTRRAFIAGQINQVVLCSDGVANVGQTEADDVLAEVADDRKQGITLTCVGVGYGAYNDAFLEAMADRGDGRYVFLDPSDEAREPLVGQLAATLQTVARDARIQVQFNPARVRRYRLIGYENRDIEDQRFRDDAVDAGEVGSGQCSTALYEMELAAPPADESDNDLGTVFVRYRDAETGQIEEISRPLAGSLIRRRSVEEDPRFFLAAGAARFAEWLRQSEHARDTSLQQIHAVLDRVSGALPLDQSVQDLAVLAHQAENLPRAAQTQP